MVHPMVDEVCMRLGSGSVCGEDVLMDILQNGRTRPRRKVTVNVTSECDLLVLSLVDALQVRRMRAAPAMAPRPVTRIAERF